jgi:hypothetical protein
LSEPSESHVPDPKTTRADRERLLQIADEMRGPAWLRQVLVTIAEEGSQIQPLNDDRSDLPEFIYRH